MSSFESAKLRAAVAEKADLIAAFKLPNTTFDKSSGTKALADILILQKRLDPLKPSKYAQEWLEDGTIRTDARGFRANKYFENHPEHIIGKPVESTHFYSTLDIDGTGRDVAKELSELMQKLPENIFVPVQFQPKIPSQIATPKISDSSLENFEFTEKDGVIYQNQVAPKTRQSELVEVPKENWATVKSYLPLRKSVDNLLKAQLSPKTTDAKLADLRQTLHKNYDNFVKNHGYLNSKQNQKILGSDPYYGRTAAIEAYTAPKKSKTENIPESAEKADIFFKRTATPEFEPAPTDSAKEAMYSTLAKTGTFDIKYIQRLTGKTEDEIIKELGDLLYKNPVTGLQELAEEYLSGNVREKLAIAKEAAKTNPEFRRNVEALQKVQPQDLTENEIATFLGSSWIDNSYYEQFARRLNGGNTISIVRDNGKFLVLGDTNDVKGMAEWSVDDTNLTLYDFLQDALNRRVRVPKTQGKPDPIKAAGCKAIVKKLNKLFDEWIFSDEERKEYLLHHFNMDLNNSVARKYDGSHLTFPGLNPEIRKKLYPHQKDAVWRIMNGKNTLLAHCVGAGKTWEMVIAGHELKRIGKIRKPIYVVPNNITEQFRKDILAAYKDAKILVLDSKNLPLGKKTDDESQKSYEEREATRRTTLARIATGDWDFIVISHEMFQRLPMSASFREQFYNEQIQILKNQLRQITMVDDGRWSDKSVAHSKKKIIADISKKILKLEQEKEKAINEAKESAGYLPFDELGIDEIFVDESDQFKNLLFKTAKENVAGISTTGSKRAWDMYQKTMWLNQQRNGGVVFASGTPVSNTLNEIFTLMRYLIPKNILKANGYSNFDEWAGNFARYVESVELHAGGGGYKLVQRAIFTNLSGLRQITDTFTDYKTAEDMPHLERPKVVGGAKEGDRIQVIVKATETQKKIMESLVERAKAIQNGGVDPSEDNLLKITSEGRKCSIDARLLDPTISEEEAGGKITAVCDNVFEEYKATKDIKGAQVISLDLGTPAKQAKSKQSEESDDEDENAEVEELTESDLKLYDIIKRGLIRRGIPAKEIAFVHDAGNDSKKRQDIFDKVNEGEIRVILGSTQKMGAGTNFQKHLTALHHLDCPWRPRDVEQREGRILRSGNLNKEVKLFVYLTEDTLDAFNWEKIKHKAAMINSFWKGNSSLTEIEDMDEMSVNAADFVAALSNNNPLMKERATLDRKIQNLKLQQTVYVQNQNKRQSQKKTLEEQIPETEKKISNIKLDIKDRVKVESGDAFRMKIGDTVYEKSTDAKAALETFLKTFDSQKSTKIGEIGGFDIMARSDVAYTVQNGDSESSKNKVYLQLKNHGSYSISAEKDPIRAMANFINKGIETTLADMEKILADDKTKLADIEKLLKEPFEQQNELKEAELRLKELDARIAEASRIKGRYNSTAIIDNLDDTTATESDRLLEKVQKSLGFHLREFRNITKPIVSFKATDNEKITQWNAENLSEAIACARYLVKEHSNSIENVGGLKIAVSDENGKAFSIDEDGVEETYSGAAEKALDELDAESETIETENLYDEIENELSREDIKTPDEFLKFVKQETGFDSIKNIGGVGNLYIVFKFKSGVFDYWNVDNVKNAIACARYLVKNCSDFIKTDKSLNSVIQVMYNDKTIFQILNMKGAEQINGEDAEKAVAELDAESETEITPEPELSDTAKKTLQKKVSNIVNTDSNNDSEKLSNAETEKAAYNGAFTSDGRLKNPYLARQAFEEKINPLRGISFINKETGISAQIGKKGVGKLVSDKAINKSVENGYTEQQHFEAAMNIKNLYENAHLAITRPDIYEQADVLSIKYFRCETEVLGEKAIAKIMAKEIVDQGHKIYTIELEELNKPAELKTRNGTESPAGSKGSTQTSPSTVSRSSEEPSVESVSQSENDSKEKVKKSEMPPENEWAENLVNNAIQAATNWIDTHFIFATTPESDSEETQKFLGTVRNELIQHAATTRALEYVDRMNQRRRKSLKKVDDFLAKKEDDSEKKSETPPEEDNEKLLRWDDLSDEEKYRRDNIYAEYKNLKIDQQLKDTLHKSYPEISEWIDKVIEVASKPLFYNRKKDSVIDYAKRVLAEYLQYESTLTKDQKFGNATYDMRGLLQRQNYLLGKKITQKHVDDWNKANEIRKNKDLTPAEAYDQMFQLLFNKDKKSVHGKFSTKIEEIIDAKKLTGKQAAIVEFSESMGVPIQFFKGDKRFHGAFRNGKIYINADSETSYDWTFWHESFHWMAKNNPALLKEISDAVGITDKQINEYRTATGREDLTDAETVEEILADNMKDVATRSGLLQEMGKKNKSLIERIISWLKSVMDKFTDFFNTPKNGLTREQKNKMYDAFGKMARSIVDSKGNAIFRFNNRTKDIELASGDLLPAVKLSARNTVINLDDELDSSGRFKNPYTARKKLQDVLNPLKGVPIKNKSTGIVAQFGKEAVGKLVSDKAVRKTLRNGYNEKQHYAAAMNIKQLYEDAVLTLQRPDRDNDPNIKDVKYFSCPTNVLGEDAVANIMVKNTLQHGHHIYTIELQELNKPAELKNQAVNDSSAGSESSTLNTRQDSTTVAEKLSAESIQQNETDGNTKYSINASDNSFVAFAKRTANRFFGESNQRERNQMRIALEEITGYKISSGHLGSGEIAVKPQSKVIRTQKAYDWTNILPEVGKIVAQKLNLPASDAMNNYIADWIFDGAPNNVSAEAKEFQRAMRAANDEYREKLLDAQNKFIAWQSKSAMEKAQAIIISEREEPSLGEKFKTTRAEGYAQFFEDIAPVKNLIDEITQETGKKFLDSENPYIAFRNYKGMAGRAKMMIEGNELTVKTLQETYPRINFNGFKTLAKILQEVGADVDDETYDEFKSYVVACHLKEIHEKNKANLAAQKKRQDNIDALKKKIAASKNQEETEELQEKLLFQQKKLKELKESFYVTPLDEKSCDEIISQYGKKYGAAQKDLVRYSNTLLAIIHDSGLMGKFVYEGLLDKWKNYVPLHRLFDENEDLAFGDSLKTMQGSARDIIDPIQAIIESTNSFIKRAEKNKAKLLLAGLVRCNGVGRLIEEVDGKKPDDHTTITFYEDGVKKYLQTDEAVVRAVNNLTVPQLNWFSRFLRIGTNIVRNFMTLLNPNFAVRNWARDAQDAFLYGGKYDKDKKIWDVAKEIIQVPLVSLRYASKGILGGRFGIGKLEDDEDFQEWMIHGGAQASFWSMDRDYAQASIEKLTRGRLKNASRWVRIKDKAAQALHLLQMFGEYSELGTRIGHYKKVKEALAKQHGGKNTYDDLVTAAFESRDLMDFARGGASSRNWNVLTAFANAHLQGIDKFRRTFSLSKLKTEEGKKEFGYSVIRLLMSSVVPAMVLFLLNHDEDWYKKDLNDYERRSHWILGENVRVPKGMDFGIRFVSNLTEDFLNWASNNKPVKFTETFINPIKDEIPDMLPTMLQPIIENSMNYDLFTKNPIVPRRLQNLPDHLQYDDRTPSLAKYLGEQFEYSPKKIEHLLFGFTGNMGKGAMRVADTVVGDKPAAVPPADWLPLIGGFFRIPYRNPRIVNEYYEQLDAQTKWNNEYQLTGKKPAGYNELLFNRLKKIQKEMKNFSKLERAAVENPNLDSAEKDRRQIAIQKKRIALIERFMR